MRAYDLAIQNFSVAEHLLQLHDLFRGLQEGKLDEPLRLAVCTCFDIPEKSILRHARNDQLVLVAKAAAPIPPSLLVEDGINFLLRQAVVVACTAPGILFLGRPSGKRTYHCAGKKTRSG